MSHVLNFKSWCRVNEGMDVATLGGYTQNAKTAIKLIEDGMSGFSLTDGPTEEGKIARGIYTIKNKEDYSHVLKHAKAKGFDTIMDWISTDWTRVDARTDFGVNDATGANDQLLDIARHLNQFNKDESAKDYRAVGNSPGRTHNDGGFGAQNQNKGTPD